MIESLFDFQVTKRTARQIRMPSAAANTPQCDAFIKRNNPL